MKTISHIRLDLSDPNFGAWVEAVQNDCNCRSVQAHLFDGRKPWPVPAGATAAVAYRKPDGTKGWYDTLADGSPAISIHGNSVAVILAAQMLTTPGKIQTALVFTDAQLNQLTTFPFIVSVEENPFVGAEKSEDYIRLTWLENKLDEYLLLAKENGMFDGEDGQSPVLVTDTVSYQAGDSGTIPPEGTWSENLPHVPKGSFLWTKRVKQWSGGSPITDYSVSYMGVDGKGTVASVNHTAPDGEGNITLTPSDVGALPSSGGTIQGPIHMNQNVLDGLNDPAEDDEAARKAYVDASCRTAAPYNLLDNSDFRNPVNQRGKASYSSTGYSIDRWKIENSGLTLSLGPGYVRVIKTSSETINISQAIGDIQSVLGKSITFALKYAGNATVVLGYYTDGTMQYIAAVKHGDFMIGTAAIPQNAQSISFYIQPQDRNEVKLYWAAVYEGVYTEDTLPVFQAKGYGAELSSCRRYYQEYNGIYCNVILGQNNDFPFWYSQPMRSNTPTVSVNAQAFLDGQWVADTAVTITPTATACRIYFSRYSATYTIGIAVSADL